MSHNSFGHLFRTTTWGESHGQSIGCVIDGTPAGIPLSEKDIQPFLDARAPGKSRFVSQRREADKVQILSGVFADKGKRPLTTGAPISMLIENTDARSKDYKNLATQLRPAHADFTYEAKYGLRDYRGGGRSSARETACRVAAGAVARKIIPKVKIRACVVQIGTLAINRKNFRWEEVERNPFWSPDKAIVKEWEKLLDSARKDATSYGAIIEVRAQNVPAGWGAPIYGKLDAELAQAMMSINAVKGVEIGAGFGAVAKAGHESGDEMRQGTTASKPKFLSNDAGGVLGGIATGQELIVRFAVKPTSSLPRARKGLTRTGRNAEVRVTGRHDPCVGIRAVPVGEAMMACVLADQFLRHRGQQGE